MATALNVPSESLDNNLAAVDSEFRKPNYCEILHLF